MTSDAPNTATSPDSTSAWEIADRAHLERLTTSGDTVWGGSKRRWWQPGPLPWLVVRQHPRSENVICMHRFEWVAELCSTRRERQHREQVGVHYTARHRTHVSKAGADR